MNKHELCKICDNKTVDLKTGLICKLTGKTPNYTDNCDGYCRNSKLSHKLEKSVIIKKL